MTQRRTIEDFGLVRDEDESHHLDDYVFLVPFAGPMTDDSEWTSHLICDPNDQDKDSSRLHEYAINTSKKVYVIFTAFLLSARAPSGRKTQMRLWQMICDNWIRAGNSPDCLRYLAVSLVVNFDVIDAMEQEWQHQIDQGHSTFGTRDQRMLTVTRANSSRTWTDNFFARSALRVAESLATAEKTLTLDKVHLIRIGEMDADARLWDMVLEFKNGDADQESYREKLIRNVLPMIAHNHKQKQAEREAGRDWKRIVFLPPNMNPGRK